MLPKNLGCVRHRTEIPFFTYKILRLSCLQLSETPSFRIHLLHHPEHLVWSPAIPASDPSSGSNRSAQTQNSIRHGFHQAQPLASETAHPHPANPEGGCYEIRTKFLPFNQICRKNVRFCFLQTVRFVWGSRLGMNQLPTTGSSGLLERLSPYIPDDLINSLFCAQIWSGQAAQFLCRAIVSS